MKKSGVLIVLSSILLLTTFVMSAESSSSDVQLRILGCTDGFNFAGVGQCVGSSFYCADHNTLLDVYQEPNACSGGRSPADGGLKDYQVCCPSKTHECVTNGTGYGASADPSDAYFCLAATKDCSDYSETECEDDHFGQCFWFDPDGSGSQDGVCTPRSNTCYEYDNELSCSSDPLNVSLKDPNCRYGSTLSGGVEYIIPQDSCNCYWDDSGTPADTSDDQCGLNYTIVPGLGGDDSSFSSCKYVFASGECVDGFEEYNYTAVFDDNTLTVLPGDARCIDRSGKRRCGQPIVQVPFFSFVNIFSVISILSLFYIAKIKLFCRDDEVF